MGLVDFSLGDIGEVIKDIREAITGEAIKDPQKAMELQIRLKELEQALDLAQIEVNKEEAKSTNWFVAGWRPAIGWSGWLGLTYVFFLNPMIQWVCSINGIDVVPPQIDGGMLFNLVIAMLGLGSMRSWEKYKNIHSKH